MAILEAYFQQFYVFVLVLTRISGLILTAPIFGPRSAPMQIRAFLAIGLALIITPLQDPSVAIDPANLIELIILIGKEALLGISLGLAVLILFTGLQITGHLIGQISGMSLTDVYDPTYETEVSVFAQLLDAVAMSAFLIIGGHRQVIEALLDTFRARPPGAVVLPDGLAATLASLGAESFVIGIRAAAPIMVALLMSVLILGLISRTLPQLNVMAVGFNLNGLIMLAVLSVCLGTMLDVLVPRVSEVIHVVRDSLVASDPH